MGNSRLQRNSVQASNVTPSLRATDVNSHGQLGFDSQSPRPIFFSCEKSQAASVDGPSVPAPTALPAAVVGAHEAMGSRVRQPRHNPSHAPPTPRGRVAPALPSTDPHWLRHANAGRISTRGGRRGELATAAWRWRTRSNEIQSMART